MTIEITVTWTDHRQETYRCSDWSLSDGVLRLDPPAYPKDQPVRNIPLANVLIWTESPA